jgi:hypothetical protein
MSLEGVGSEVRCGARQDEEDTGMEAPAGVGFRTTISDQAENVN